MTKKIVEVDSSRFVFTIEVVNNQILSVKTSSGYLPKHLWPQCFLPKQVAVEEETYSGVNLGDLLEKHLNVFYRETRSLLERSSHGKLDKDSAHSMRENIKLLLDLKKKEKELLDELTIDELKASIEKAKNEKT